MHLGQIWLHQGIEVPLRWLIEALVSWVTLFVGSGLLKFGSLAVPYIFTLWMVLVCLGLLIGLGCLLRMARMVVAVPAATTLLLIWLILISLSLRKRVGLICDLYLSFIHVGAAAYPHSIYEVGFYLQDILSVLDAVEFNESESLVFPRGGVLQAVG